MNIVIILIGIIIIHIIIKIAFFWMEFSFDYVYYMNYDVEEIENVLTKEECDELINISLKKGLKDSQVWNPDSTSSIDDSHRISSQLWLDKDIPLVNKIMQLSEKYSGFPMNTQESLQVVKYDIGGKFNSHYDGCVFGKNSPNCKMMNGESGQRRTTFMIYLNDNYEGGETEFFYLNKKIIPKTGKAILFKDSDEYDNVIFQSFHSGNPVTSGNKWICTVWSHANKR